MIFTYRISCSHRGHRYSAPVSFTVDAEGSDIPREIAVALRDSYKFEDVELFVVDQRRLLLDEGEGNDL
jgi:hypothetical protein